MKQYATLTAVAVGIIILIMLTGCTTKPKQDVETYKVLWGKRCTENGHQFSYLWFHTVYGSEQVKKEWCNNAK